MNQTDAIDYGRGAAADRRRWLHKCLVQMADADELPTTVSSLYYAGIGEGQWLSDAEAEHAGRKRLPRQDVSDAVQWLIERLVVDADGVVDVSRSVLDHRRPLNLRDSTYEYAMRMQLSGWADLAVPVVIVESRSLASALDGTADRYSIILVPLGGMSGRTFLRKVARRYVATSTPIAYLGDWNPAGAHIENNAHDYFREQGWTGEWSMLAVTDDDAAGRPTVTKLDKRNKPPRQYESVEAEAIGTTELRRRLAEWLDDQLPDDFTWADHEARTSTERAELLALFHDD